jgi:hypothetical protein
MPELPTLTSVILDSDEDDGDYAPEEQGQQATNLLLHLLPNRHGADSDSDSETGPDTKKQRVEDTLSAGTASLVANDT